MENKIASNLVVFAQEGRDLTRVLSPEHKSGVYFPFYGGEGNPLPETGL